jgi:transglutaminase-like putative cysteine protease
VRLRGSGRNETALIFKAQHCRAEVYLTEYGWVPVDPADVRKVVLEEPPGNLPLEDKRVQKARARLFGSWEMNWMAFNFAHDVSLPESRGGPVGFFMYAQASGLARCGELQVRNYELGNFVNDRIVAPFL